MEKTFEKTKRKACKRKGKTLKPRRHRDKYCKTSKRYVEISSSSMSNSGGDSSSDEFTRRKRGKSKQLETEGTVDTNFAKADTCNKSCSLTELATIAVAIDDSKKRKI